MPLALPKLPPAFICLGGTGVIGFALAGVLRVSGIHFVSVSLSPDARSPGHDNIRLDFATAPPGALTAALDGVRRTHRVIGILDVFGCTGDVAADLACAAAALRAPVAVLSSCLLYDHDGRAPIDETCPLIATPCPPYQATKLALEASWRVGTFPDWLILRAHHILGRGSLLGCIPAHNRDARLLDIIAAGEPLQLARRGDVRLSIIHPADLGAAALHLLTRTGLRRTTVNLAHPTPVRAFDYYARVATELGAPLPPIVDFTPDPANFWSVTARDNVFVSARPEMASFAFTHDLDACIRDALSVGPRTYARQGGFLRARIAGH
ncbi:MAG: hypothetical protein GC146_05210 [Limimaricola sp.]|uniref:NAD-dependent epimerase/dehydratase family protein n=1 Tax=Limimaricola sp. TaxID=2211665 RepID=UPI001DB2FAD8|nr:NAD-dependent epimerase/dehydratase family protein [Limimaricola sp.]MBI1416605.1 hypothetical protein [Limimaricola sp.]